MRAWFSYITPPALWFVTLVLLVCLHAPASAQIVVPITREPNHHLVISNAYVRVFQVEVPPKADTLYHQHDYDYLYVAIGDADVTSTRLHEKPVAVKLKDGEVEFSKGPFAHKATNNSDQPFRNVTIELLHGAGKVLCRERHDPCGQISIHRIGNAREGGSSVQQELVMHTANLTVQKVELRGGAGIDPIHDLCLLIPLSDSNLIRISQKSTEELSLKAGYALWIDEPNTQLKNSSHAARLILISFSPVKTQ